MAYIDSVLCMEEESARDEPVDIYNMTKTWYGVLVAMDDQPITIKRSVKRWDFFMRPICEKEGTWNTDVHLKAALIAFGSLAIHPDTSDGTPYLLRDPFDTNGSDVAFHLIKHLAHWDIVDMAGDRHPIVSNGNCFFEAIATGIKHRFERGDEPEFVYKRCLSVAKGIITDLSDPTHGEIRFLLNSFAHRALQYVFDNWPSCKEAIDVQIASGLYILLGLWQPVDDDATLCGGDVPRGALTTDEVEHLSTVGNINRTRCARGRRRLNTR